MAATTQSSYLGRQFHVGVRCGPQNMFGVSGAEVSLVTFNSRWGVRQRGLVRGGVCLRSAAPPVTGWIFPFKQLWPAGFKFHLAWFSRVLHGWGDVFLCVPSHLGSGCGDVRGLLTCCYNSYNTMDHNRIISRLQSEHDRHLQTGLL